MPNPSPKPPPEKKPVDSNGNPQKPPAPNGEKKPGDWTWVQTPDLEESKSPKK